MWPLLLASLIAVFTVVERLLFYLQERSHHAPRFAEDVFVLVDKGQFDKAVEIGTASPNFVARTLAYGIQNRELGLDTAVMRASASELRNFHRGLPTLDTIVTLAPLLGLLGTVTGLIHAFALLGRQEINGAAAITGGIAQALIATGFGLAIAIIALVPHNMLNARLESARLEIEDAANRLELLLARNHHANTITSN